MTNTLRYGALFFDKDPSYERGFLAVEEEEARRLGTDGVFALPSDLILLTNLSWDSLQASGLSTNTRFVHDCYLKHPCYRLALEYGMESPQAQAEFCSTIFSRMMKSCAELFNIDNFLPSNGLRKGLRELLGFGADNEVVQDVAAALAAATVYNSTCLHEIRSFDESDMRRFRVPELTHCKYLLKELYPIHGFIPIPYEELPDGNDKNTVLTWLDYVTNHGQKNGLFRVRCSNMSSPEAGLLNPNEAPASYSTSGGGLQSLREWVVSPELNVWVKYADVDIFQGYISQTDMPFTKATEFLNSFPEWTQLSLTMRLIFDNIWSAMTSRHPRGLRARPSFIRACGAAPFLRAKDRMRLFSYARAIHEKGYMMSGYASGTLRVLCENRPDHELFELAQDLHLIPPFLNIPPEELPHPFSGIDDFNEFLTASEQNPELVLNALQVLYASGRKKVIMHLDQAVLRRLLKSFQ